ncbi:hypothetical protein PT974_03121 [Cladobotryum mycophilum]|uniref:EGF-like domain-containing protein n=1 Tax=Cladobotryum mycophilum TaxID=491253 RepID=A0ABR0SRD6_9HYPO
MKPLRQLLTLLSLTALSHQSCTADEDCSLNGICGSDGTCLCDAGWIAADCGALDVRPAKRPSGYNLTDIGTSSWGSKIIQDPLDHNLYHLFAAEFTHNCGLDYWAPYSRIIRAESRSGPAGPYTFAAEVMGTFSHNPTVVYSPADEEWLLYYIGCPTDVSATCTGKTFTCGPGNSNNGESGIAVLRSADLIHWEPRGQVMLGDDTSNWDADVTNPSAFPLYSDTDKTHAMLLVYRGCPQNCSGAPELISAAVSESGYSGPYVKIGSQPFFTAPNEDPFVWRDKRGHFHMLLHSIEPDGGFGSGPKVGRHAWARNYSGPWTFGKQTLAFSTEVQYDDGATINFYRRERPQLYFSDDGQQTPLLLTTGVQPRDNPMSYSVIVPVGDAGVKVQG